MQSAPGLHFQTTRKISQPSGDTRCTDRVDFQAPVPSSTILTCTYDNLSARNCLDGGNTPVGIRQWGGAELHQSSCSRGLLPWMLGWGSTGHRQALLQMQQSSSQFLSCRNNPQPLSEERLWDPALRWPKTLDVRHCALCFAVIFKFQAEHVEHESSGPVTTNLQVWKL